jgi:hypothetical protein
MNNKNFSDSDKYKEQRVAVEKRFTERKLKPVTTKEHLSPSNNYKLVTINLDNGEGYWDFIKGTVTDIRTGEEIFIILRNYGSFWYQWIEHQNGKEYLLCGEDYQGYVCLNLTERKKHVYFSEGGFKGWGFCWTEVKEYYKDTDNTIRVEGCYWGAQFEEVEYDFSDPDTLPYREISRHDVDYEDDDEDDEENENDKNNGN